MSQTVGRLVLDRRIGAGGFATVWLARDPDLDALVAHMQAHGVRFRKPVRDEPAFRYVMVAGPDELLIELYECREPARWGIER